jgi:hypothetical protein
MVQKSKIPKCVELRTQQNTFKQKLKKVDLENLILKYDALKIIYIKNFIHSRDFDDMVTGRNLVSNRETSWVFSAIFVATWGFLLYMILQIKNIT